MEVKRGVGICYEEECVQYKKHTFIYNPDKRYFCTVCNNEGYMIQERCETMGKGENYTCVRIEFDFDPGKKKFRGLAIVKMENTLEIGKTYILYSPLIRTENRALKCAESTLAKLRNCQEAPIGEVVRPTEETLNLSLTDKEYKEALERLAAKWNRR